MCSTLEVQSQINFAILVEMDWRYTSQMHIVTEINDIPLIVSMWYHSAHKCHSPLGFETEDKENWRGYNMGYCQSSGATEFHRGLEDEKWLYTYRKINIGL